MRLVVLVLVVGMSGVVFGQSEPLRIATFAVDATPPLGAPLCNGNAPPVEKVVRPLSCRGVVLCGAGQPVVLCAVDWIGIGNGGYAAFREALAEAAGTTPDRVAVHALHQHDAPACDFAVEKLLAEHGLSGAMFDPAFARRTIRRAAGALAEAMNDPKRITHLGLGKGEVEKVASNRRLFNDKGKLIATRMSSTRDAEVRALPEGEIDPYLWLISFWDEDRPLAVLSYYATHPQSYYRTGGVNPDFPGIARAMREEALPGVLHVHFTGAAGDVAAGKYNDGSPAMRPVLAERLARGMERAWEATRKRPIRAEDVGWTTLPVLLPPRASLDEEELVTRLRDEALPARDRIRAARDLVWLRRCTAGDRIDLSCLRLGEARVLHMPGELFVRYQLRAQAMRPELFVAMAAYGDYGPGYIGYREAYAEGGYEVGAVSRVAPEAEDVLTAALRKLLDAE